MGIFAEYLQKQLTFNELTNERIAQLSRIAKLRNREIMVFASDLTKGNISSINYTDILPFSEQLSSVKGDDIDIILETPGGLAEVVEDLVSLIRARHRNVGIIVPGFAKSAGTIFAMAADEILMGELSALGPIDAQIVRNEKIFSADAFLAKFNELKKEIALNKNIDLIYIPMLRNLSLGEIQHCENAQNLSKSLVQKWLKEYKFKDWNIHSSTKQPVTPIEKAQRAEDIAKLLCDQGHWLTHARSIKIRNLEEMGLLITDYSKNNELNDAITRYYTLLRMSFETNIYKIYETPSSRICRSVSPKPSMNNSTVSKIHNPLIMDLSCPKCGTKQKLQVNFGQHFPQFEGMITFPADNNFKCPVCCAEINLLALRQNLEAQVGKRIM